MGSDDIAGKLEPIGSLDLIRINIDACVAKATIRAAGDHTADGHWFAATGQVQNVDGISLEIVRQPREKVPLSGSSDMIVEHEIRVQHKLVKAIFTKRLFASHSQLAPKRE
jgi:hypothetical protein